MKLAPRLTLALTIGIFTVHSGAAAFRVYRENAVFRADMGRDARVLGRALAFAAERAWQTGGEAEVIALAEHTTGRKEDTRVRWVRPRGAGTSETEPLDNAAAKQSLQLGNALTITQTLPEQALLTYVPVVLPGGEAGALELLDPLDDELAYIRTSITAAAIAVFVLVALCGAVAWLLSARMIGAPILALIRRTQGVAAGDLKNRLAPFGSEELQLLAAEINRMCDRLELESERAAAAASARALATEQLRHADRLATVGSLASRVAHELGTPLNVVNGHAQLIGEYGVDEQVKNHLRIIQAQCARMTRMIRQWLDFSRRGRELDMQCDVGEAVQEAVGMLLPTARSAQVNIEYAGAKAQLSAALGKPALQQVLLNLALNGIQAMPQGGLLKLDVERLEAATPERNPHAPPKTVIRVRVADTGEGIPQEIQEQMFEPFFTTKPPGSGTGLGLSIASGIVQDCGGWLQVTSTPTAGTVFDVYIPAP